MLAHVPDINDIVAGLKTLLKPDGVFVLETPYFKPFIEDLEFDTIYHEHIFYYSLTALDQLFDRHGLKIQAVEFIPLHGGSAKVSVMHADRVTDRPEVKRILNEEHSWGVMRAESYSQFSHQVLGLKKDLCRLLSDLKSQGKRIVAYGAAAKGSTLLNFIGIGRETLEYVVDRSHYKQGRYMPGSRLPILPVDQILRDQPDYTLLLTWNFAGEILEQQAEYRRRGGKFIIPIPSPHTV